MKDDDNELHLFEEGESAEEIRTYLRKKGLPFYTNELEMVPGSIKLEKEDKFLLKPKKVKLAELSNGVVGIAAAQDEKAKMQAWKAELEAQGDEALAFVYNGSSKLDELSDVQLLKAAFECVDFDGNGSLDKEEWAVVTNFCDQMGAANGKGILENSFTVQREREMNLNDFINVGISILRKQSTQSKKLKMALKDLVEARQAFVACDPNGNGQVEAEEMETVMKIIGVKNVRIEDCKQLVELLDLDGNGMIDWREFVLSHNSELVISDKNAYGVNRNKILEMHKKFSMNKDGEISALPAYLARDAPVNQDTLRNEYGEDKMDCLEKWGVNKIADCQSHFLADLKKHARSKVRLVEWGGLCCATTCHCGGGKRRS